LYVGPIFHSYEISPVMLTRILPTSGIRAKGSCQRDSDRLIQWGAHTMGSVEEGLSLEGEIVRYPSVTRWAIYKKEDP